MLDDVMATSVAVPLASYSRGMWLASEGRDGTFALVIASTVPACAW